MLKTIFWVGILVLCGSTHYHYGDKEHYYSYHTFEGVMGQIFQIGDTGDTK